jgi:hypothetical protein
MRPITVRAPGRAVSVIRRIPTTLDGKRTNASFSIKSWGFAHSDDLGVALST